VYTQCPECEVVYRVTSAHLRLAGGEVECGACGARFDALDRLSDTYPTGPAEDGPAAEEAPGSATDAEAGETAEEAAEEEAPGEAAGDGEPDATPAEETTGDEPTEPALPEAEVAAEVGWEVVSEEQVDGEEEQDDEPTVDLDMTTEELFSVQELRDQEIPDIGDLEFVEGLPSGQAPVESGPETPPAELVARRPPALVRRAGTITLLVLAAGLVATAVHSQRGALMRSPAIAPLLERVYGVLGVPVAADWNVSGFRILESAAEIDGSGDLQVTLRFANEADFAQPCPVLRVSLEDRWGDEIGSRDLLPAEYLPADLAGRRMSSGRETQGHATIRGTPPAAVGFRLDLCLPDAAGGMTCLSNQP